MLENRYMDKQEQFFNLAYSKGYNFEIMNKPHLESFVKAIEYHYGIDSLKEIHRTEPYPSAKKLFVLLVNEAYPNRSHKEVMSRINKDRSSYPSDLKRAKELLEVNKEFREDYKALRLLLNMNDDKLNTPEYAKNLIVIDAEVC